MSSASAAVPADTASSAALPRLIFFHSARSGRCRRIEGFLAQVLQRRHNHETFLVYRVDQDEQPDLVERFRIEEVPTLLVAEGKEIRAKLVSPGSCREISKFLAPWLK